MNIKLLIEGGDMKPGPAIAQQLGPLGLNLGKVISDVNKETQNFKGMKVPVELNVNEKTKQYTIFVSSPPTSELLKKELKLEKGSHDHKNISMGNASIEDVIKIAKIKHPNMLEKNIKNAVKSILGTCASVGILVENKNPNELIKEVNVLLDQNLVSKKSADEIYKFFVKINGIFNIIDFKKLKKSNIPDEVKKLLRDRESYRKNSEWQKADEARQELLKYGYEVQDSKKVSTLKKI